MNLVVAVPIFIATLVWLTFFIWLTVRAKWWDNHYGVNNGLVSLAIFFVLARLSILHAYPEASDLFRNTGGVLYTVFALLGIQRIALLERAQREMDDIARMGKNLPN